MSPHNISVNRDFENDVLYVVRTDIDLAKIANRSYDSSILLRIDVSTRKIVGLTIEEFTKVFSELKDLDEYHLMETFDRIIGLMNAPHTVNSR